MRHLFETGSDRTVTCVPITVTDDEEEVTPVPTVDRLRTDGGTNEVEDEPGEEPGPESPDDSSSDAPEEDDPSDTPTVNGYSKLDVELEQLEVVKLTDDIRRGDEIGFTYVSGVDDRTKMYGNYDQLKTEPVGDPPYIEIGREGGTAFVSATKLGEFGPVQGDHIGFATTVVFFEWDPFSSLKRIFEAVRDIAVEATSGFPTPVSIPPEVIEAAGDVLSDLFGLVFGGIGVGHDKMPEIVIQPSGDLPPEKSVYDYLLPSKHSTWTLESDGDDRANIIVPLVRHGGEWKATFKIVRTVIRRVS